MTSPVYPVYEGDGGVNAPKRPTADVDLGGLGFVDSVKYPPKDRERLSATDYMQVTMSLERIARMTPVLVADFDIEVGLTGNPDYVVCVNDTVTTASVTLSETSSGHYRVTIPAGKIPTANCKPKVDVINSGGAVASVEIASYSATQFNLVAYDFAGSATGNSATVKLSVY